MAAHPATQAIVIGSGAGGATTALALAKKGVEVLVLEEGRRHSLAEYGKSSPQAMCELYRSRGMTPIMGRVPIGYVEGRCYGGSTEINSGFWHRTPPETLLRWKANYDLAHAHSDDLKPHFEWAEELLGVGLYGGEWPESTRVFHRGIEAMGWSAQEIPRVVTDCRGRNRCASGCPTGAKRSMSLAVLPRAEELGAKVLTGCRVRLLIRRGRRIQGVLASIERDDGTQDLVHLKADHVFVCAGATETPALLHRSGIRLHVGNSLRVHPMLKVVARFESEIRADDSVLPLIQVKEFWPEISLGGAYATPGHLALALSDNWQDNREQMKHFSRMASYYVAVRGTGSGTVRSRVGGESCTIRYELSHEDRSNLSRGFARLCMSLLAGGAVELYPSIFGCQPIQSDTQAARWLDHNLPTRQLSLSTVHAFGSCPMGERTDLCAANSFGQVHHLDNLYINDASMLPNSPGVNPQGTIMALASRNALHFLEELK